MKPVWEWAHFKDPGNKPKGEVVADRRVEQSMVGNFRFKQATPDGTYRTKTVQLITTFDGGSTYWIWDETDRKFSVMECIFDGSDHEPEQLPP